MSGPFFRFVSVRRFGTVFGAVKEGEYFLAFSGDIASQSCAVFKKFLIAVSGHIVELEQGQCCVAAAAQGGTGIGKMTAFAAKPEELHDLDHSFEQFYQTMFGSIWSSM